MFVTEDTQSEQTARFLIETIGKAMKKGDLKSAARRVRRVKSLIADRSLDRKLLGELMLLAAEVARAGGKAEQAEELVQEILGGRGGIPMEVIGQAKRLRARLFLDQGMFEDAEALAETADRYIITGLMEEKIEMTAGREIRVNVPVQQKFLDQGEHVSVETFLLLSEIAVLRGDWEKAADYVNHAAEKDAVNNHFFQEVAMWKGILEMAEGGSLIGFVEPILSRGKASAILIGRIEALLNEPRREDSAINEAEYFRFRRISELSREFPLKEANQSVEMANREIVDNCSESQEESAAHREVDNDPGLIINANLSRMSMMQVIGIIDIEKITGVIDLTWNQEAIREGVAALRLDKNTSCGKGTIYCREGQIVDAEFGFGAKDNLNDDSGLPSNPSDRSRSTLRQLLFIALGGGSELLSDIQARKVSDLDAIKQNDIEIPSVTAEVRLNPSISDRENLTQISTNLNFLLDVAKEIDEYRGGVSSEDEDIDWDADWGSPATNSAAGESDKGKTAVEPKMVKSSDLKFDALSNILDIAHSTSFTGYLELTWKTDLYEKYFKSNELPSSLKVGKGYLLVVQGAVIDACIGKIKTSTGRSEALDNFSLMTRLAYAIGLEETPVEITVEAFDYEPIQQEQPIIRILPDHLIGILTNIANAVYKVSVEDEVEIGEDFDFFSPVKTNSQEKDDKKENPANPIQTDSPGFSSEDDLLELN